MATGITGVEAITMSGYIPEHWKQTRPYQLVLAFVVGLGFALEVLAPRMADGNLRYELKEVRSEVSAARAEVAARDSKLVETGKQIEALRQQLSKAARDVLDAQQSGLFIFGSPYPIGLSNVRIGDPITKIDAVYGEKVEKDGRHSWVLVRDAHSLFRRAVYYHDNGKVTGILLFLDNAVVGIDRDFLRRKLTEALGDPVTATTDKLVWDNKSGTTASMDNDTLSVTYFINVETKVSATSRRSRDITTGSQR